MPHDGQLVYRVSSAPPPLQPQIVAYPVRQPDLLAHRLLFIPVTLVGVGSMK